MKKTIVLMIISFLAITSYAQNEEAMERREKMEELKNEYIMKRMELSKEESEKMEAIHSEFHEKRMEQRKNQEELIRELKSKRKEKLTNDEEFTEEEARKSLTKRLEMEEARIKTEREYTERMISAISAKKTLEYKKLEREFKRELLEMLKDDAKHHQMRKEFMEKERHHHQKKERKMND